MPEISQDQANILDAISQAVRGSSSSFTQQSQRSDTPSSKQSPAEKADRVRAEKATSNFKDASQLFHKAVKSEYKTKEQWRLQVEKNGQFLNDAVSAVSQQSNLGSGAFKGLEDMFQMEEQLEALQDIRESFRDSKGMLYGPELQAVEDKLKSFGMTLEDIGGEAVEGEHKKRMMVDGQYKQVKTVIIPQYGKLNNAMSDTSENLKDASDGLKDLADTAEKSKISIQGVMAGVTVSAKMFVDESRIAMRKGVGDARDGFADTATMIAKLGISTSKYMELMADNRQVQLAMQSAGKSWKEELVSMSNELMTNGLVGSMEEAAVASAAFMKNTAMMGVAQGELGTAVKDQAKIYQKNFRALGISTDQFNALTEDLINDVDVRKDLAKLQGGERRAYIESLQKRTAENVMMGYSIDRAKELNKHFAKMSDEDPLERLSEAAKMRAGLGALGMGNEGARMQELMVKMPTMNEQDRIKAQKEMTQIQAKAQNLLQKKMGESVEANIAFGQLFSNSNLGLKDTLEGFQTTTREGMQIAKKGETAQEATLRLAQNQAKKNEVDTLTMVGVRAVDTFQAAATSSATVAATMLASYIFAGGLQKSMGLMEGMLTKIASTGVGTGGAGIGGGKGKMGKMMGGAVKGAGIVGAAMIGWEVGTAIGDQITDAWQGTDSYKSFSEGLGKSVDFVAQLWNDDAKIRRMDADELKKHYAEQRALQLETIAETKKVSANTGATKDSVDNQTVQNASDTEKNRMAVEKAERNRNMKSGAPGSHDSSIGGA